MNILFKDNPWRQFPIFYNVYPIINEVHFTSLQATPPENPSSENELLIDTYYGRIYSNELFQNGVVYGQTDKMDYYVNLKNFKIIDELRVPFRRIPVFYTNNLAMVETAITEIQKANSSYKILLRGQNKIYPLQRNSLEAERLFGSKKVIEPSFLPSYLRTNFDELFIYSMWLNQAAILLNDIGFYYEYCLSKDQLEAYKKDVRNLRHSFHFTPFSLGIAQHYGLPSVGLDLTDKLKIAAWFALNKISIDDSGHAVSSLVKDNASPMIFIFRCPERAVFNYEFVRPKIFPIGRPDMQHAWFGHVGWGAASNQLASYLVCGFKIDNEISEQLPLGFESTLFPSITKDPILEFFVKMKNMQKYEGEAKRALNRIYYFL